MSAIRHADLKLIECLFNMSGGYVLDFTDQTFAEFFADELNVNICESKYSVDGVSKGKRLRRFLRSSEPKLLVQSLIKLWEYREAGRRRNGATEAIPNAAVRFRELIERLGGSLTRHAIRDAAPAAGTAIDNGRATVLKEKLLALNNLEPQQRGYAFEKFLIELFAAHQLSPRGPFRLVGEQIDGSFELNGETYLLEAKWCAPKIGASELRAFEGKVTDKAGWTRGLFVSESGFTAEGLTAFGRAKHVVLMDGLDLYSMLERELPVAEVMATKVRHAAETGEPFVSVRELYPLAQLPKNTEEARGERPVHRSIR